MNYVINTNKTILINQLDIIPLLNLTPLNLLTTYGLHKHAKKGAIR